MLTPKPADISRTTAMSAVEASVESMAAVIVVLTVSGRYIKTLSVFSRSVKCLQSKKGIAMHIR